MSLALAISSKNGLDSTRRAFQMMGEGGDTLDAAIAGVQLVEDDPQETSVGLGGLPNEEGIVELDAAVMHGPTHLGGGVAAVRGIRHVARLAKLVMERTDHALLVGEGARKFALAHGFEEENLLTEKARKIWLYWKETLSTRHDWIPPAADNVDPEVAEFFKLAGASGPASTDAAQTNLPAAKVPQWEQPETTSTFDRPKGTIHCAARNEAGDISCATTTSGLAFKIPGRVGDSPILGAGLYVDNQVGSCGSVGRGEANVENCSSVVAVELMRQGRSPLEAGLEILQRIAERTPERLRDAGGRPAFDIKFFLVGKSDHAAVSMWDKGEYAITDSAGTRLEPTTPLFTRD